MGAVNTSVFPLLAKMWVAPMPLSERIALRVPNHNVIALCDETPASRVARGQWPLSGKSYSRERDIDGLPCLTQLRNDPSHKVVVTPPRRRAVQPDNSLNASRKSPHHWTARLLEARSAETSASWGIAAISASK
ncbi:hypothetical protein KCP75_03045 [Salmonella enterica subsp. enterica]|nr:hypothetical protein KCP75_03045 [Salmonella enterica subsp. enterica]